MKISNRVSEATRKMVGIEISNLRHFLIILSLWYEKVGVHFIQMSSKTLEIGLHTLRQFEQADSSLGCLLFEMASAFPEMILFNRKGKFLALLKKKSMGK